MIDRLLRIQFYILLVATPLIWYSKSYELFEYNKMMFIYMMTTTITLTWILKATLAKKLEIKISWFHLPVLLFLLANILSTIFSIDPHTSIWGYYSRSNGGLLSILCYILLYFTLVSNFERKDILSLLKATLLGGLVTALYAIPEHFGTSPSCILLHFQFNDSCWIQDVKARVFATLGQPNWLAAYMAMLIFPGIYFVLTARSFWSKLGYLLLVTCYYLSLTFTYSQGGFLGFGTGLVVFLLGLIVVWGLTGRIRVFAKTTLLLTGITVFSLLLVNLIFGSALGRLNLSRYLPQSGPNPIKTKPNPAQPTTPQVNQLENGGTDSGKIRLIVWSGAWQVFLHYPILGSGVETFAYSYYQFRPAAHNLVSEWDFLYNKAHNEYLNYLATTGAVGFISYLTMIGSLIVLVLIQLLTRLNSQQSKNLPLDSGLLLLAILSSYLAYLVQNFFGFSVVIIALLFYLFPGLILLTQENRSFIFKIQGQTWQRVIQILSVMAAGWVILILGSFWQADQDFAQGSNLSDGGYALEAYSQLSQAASLNRSEPFYRSELGYAAAASAVTLSTKDATLSGELQKDALLETQIALKTSPANVSYWRTAIRTYYALAVLNPKLNDLTLKTIDQAIKLAPTDAKLFYNKALILDQLKQPEEALAPLNQAIGLKSNYREAYLTKADVLKELGRNDQAKQSLEIVLKLVPNDPEALDRLKSLGK